MIPDIIKKPRNLPGQMRIHSRASVVNIFAKLAKGFYLLTIFAKTFVLRYLTGF